MHKTTGVRDPAATFPLPRLRNDVKDRREAKAGRGNRDTPQHEQGQLGRREITNCLVVQKLDFQVKHGGPDPHRWQQSSGLICRNSITGQRLA
jgi:hypothetical protein